MIDKKVDTSDKYVILFLVQYRIYPNSRMVHNTGLEGGWVWVYVKCNRKRK